MNIFLKHMNHMFNKNKENKNLLTIYTTSAS